NRRRRRGTPGCRPRASRCACTSPATPTTASATTTRTAGSTSSEATDSRSSSRLRPSNRDVPPTHGCVMNLHVGTSGYSYPKWKGSFYPAKLPAKQMLRFYGTQFRTVEINSTFYGPPKPSVLETWLGEVPEHFRFVLKAPQQITHVKRLVDA